MSFVSIAQPLASIPSVNVAPAVLFDPSAGYVQAAPASSSLSFLFTAASALNGWTVVITAYDAFDYSGGGLPTGAVASVEVRDADGALFSSISGMGALGLSVSDLVADAGRALALDDVLNGSSQADDLDGMTGDDVLNGGAGDDRGFGGAGDDVFNGGDGADSFLGGAGGDYGYGNTGADSLLGEAGDDFLYGGQGDDLITGGDGHDVAAGGVGSDIIAGGSGEDLIFGNADADTITGGDHFDRLFGEAGDDILRGENGGDEIRGGNGADDIDGGQGDDDLYGNAMDDIIEGGGGVDRMTGGAGADRFVFAGRTPVTGDSVAGSGFHNGTADTVLDFSGAEGDRLDFNIAASSANYFEKQMVISDPVDGFNDARVLADDVFLTNEAAIYVAIQYTAGASSSGGVGGVVIFLDTDGDNHVDQQVTLVGLTLADIDPSFLV